MQVGAFSSFTLSAWRRDGSDLSGKEIEDLQNYAENMDMMDVMFDKESPYSVAPYIASFYDESYNAKANAYDALKAYAIMHPDVLLELTCDSDEMDVHNVTRFLGHEAEEHNRFENYAPFTKLIVQNESDRLPIVGFDFKREDGTLVESVHVLLHTCLDLPTRLEIEDSIASYCEDDGIIDSHKMLHEVLDAAGIEHIILDPYMTIDV